MQRLRQLSVSFVWMLTCGLLATLPGAPDVVAAPPQQARVLVQFKKTPGAAERKVVTDLGGTVQHSYKIVPAVAATLPEAALAALRKNPNVVVVEPDGVVQAVDAELDAVWGVRRIGSGFAHASGLTGATINVAVIDTGIDYNHPELQAVYKGGYDFVNSDPDPMDDHGHGTHCSGSIAAADNNAAIVGVAPSVNLYGLKVLDAGGSGSFSDIIAAVDWCRTNGVVEIDLTNNSYGSSGNPGTIVEQAFINANQAGILNICAAGNSGDGGTTSTVIYPARYSSVVAVAATTSSDTRASFSSTGPQVDVAAPGASIYSTVPGGGYATWSGTSMACPHAVGTSAVLWGLARDVWGDAADNNYIRTMLAASATDLGSAGFDNSFGDGLVDVEDGIAMVLATEPGAVPPPPPAITMKVSSISYSTSGSRRRDLLVTVTVLDLSNVAVPSASVNVTIRRNGASYATNTGITGSTGRITFTLASAPAGTYSTVVNSVTKTGYVWNGSYPANSYNKK